MGLRARIVELLSRGDAPERDPREPIEIAVVRLIQAPLLVAGLQREGFDAEFSDAMNVGTRITNDARIFVPREQAAGALEGARSAAVGQAGLSLPGTAPSLM